MLAAALALIIYNSPFGELYDKLLHVHLSIMVGDIGLDKSLLHWINDGLMVIFFFYIGLEIKREVIGGELSSIRKASLPIIAALGGVVFPALIYVYINMADEVALHGWAVPVATDIAFAIGVLALLGNVVPRQLKVLLLSLAIIDDLAAIIIIAIFYTEHLSFNALGISTIAFACAILLNRTGVKRITPYVLIGIVMWIAVLKSGVHATLAGVFLATCIPMQGKRTQDGEPAPGLEGKSPLKRLEHALHPWVSFMIMPIFAFANAGVELSGMSFEDLGDTIPLGIILGLFFGKQIGVFLFIWLGDMLRLCQKPDGVSWIQIYGLSILTGIGFTMSLFIGTLAFSDPHLMSEVRIGVLIASSLSAILGYIVLYMTTRGRASAPPAE